MKKFLYIKNLLKNALAKKSKSHFFKVLLLIAIFTKNVNNPPPNTKMTSCTLTGAIYATYSYKEGECDVF